MKIALASAPAVTGEVEHNIVSILRSLEHCSGKADLVVFGESFLQGFECLTWDYEADRVMAVSKEGAEIRRIREAAAKNRIAVSFGYIEKAADSLYSSQIVIDASGEIIHNFQRVSAGWKEFWHTDGRYREGRKFETFAFDGKKFAIGLCGDLWAEGRPEEMKALNVDIVLWPVWCDYKAADWNEKIRYEYAGQAAKCGNIVLYVNPFCADPGVADAASGGAAYFQNGQIIKDMPAGERGILIVEI
ncbi:carbon-nitrogen hydrolase family protein [Sellimonas sp.]|uniref:carbon-nitrogen hydrolase family protein n=1 Tax=Sellimonas sp. TaxID=2021466 RepID=UPI00257D31DB|nr:carbon-nitrogen hydrolase family protein [Sellimonas sp.]